MSRSASQSYKGYTYQRSRLLHLIFCEYYTSKYEQLNSISFSEENLEDIDIYKTDNNGNTEIYLYQEKYLNSNKEESLNEDSGLTKVIISHYANEEITKINYEVVSTSGNISYSKKLTNFIKLINDNINNHLIGKFIALNYCDGKLFSTQENYETFIQDIKKTQKDINKLINKKFNGVNETDNTNKNKLKKFCHYCNNTNNIQQLIKYLQKINISISDNTFDKIHDNTISALKKILPEFNEMCNHMSEHYKEFYSETLYGLFEMIIVKNLFLTNNKMTIKQLLDIIKDKIKNSLTNDDKLTIVIYTINHFINENKYNDIKSLLFNNNSFVDYILTDKITITKIICNFDKEKIYNHNIQDIVRQIIYKIVILKNYNFVNDIKLLSFLYRSYTTLKLNRKIYKSLQEIDECISSNKWL